MEKGKGASMTAARIAAKLLRRLAAIDTPTVCNTMDLLKVEQASRGFVTQPFVCLDPGAGPVVGFARTATCRAVEPSSRSPAEDRRFAEAYVDYLASGPRPSIIVVQDLDGERAGFGALWGEVNSNVHKALGCLGLVTNGSVRDVDMWAEGFHAIAGSIGPSHAHVHHVDFGSDVQVLGMWVRNGDLVHADRHGAVVIPKEVAPLIPETAARQARREAVILEACKDPDFTVEKLKKAFRAAEHVR